MQVQYSKLYLTTDNLQVNTNNFKMQVLDDLHSFSVLMTEKLLIGVIQLSIVQNYYGLWIKRKVNMAGYPLSSFLFVFIDQDDVQVHNYAKNYKANILINKFITFIIFSFIGTFLF